MKIYIFVDPDKSRFAIYDRRDWRRSHKRFSNNDVSKEIRDYIFSYCSKQSITDLDNNHSVYEMEL